MDNKYYGVLKKNILSNKGLIFSTIFIGLLGFGYSLITFSVSADDAAAFQYFSLGGYGNLVQ